MIGLLGWFLETLRIRAPRFRSVLDREHRSEAPVSGGRVLRGRRLAVLLAALLALLLVEGPGSRAPFRLPSTTRLVAQPSVPPRVGANTLVSPSGSSTIYMEPAAAYDPTTHATRF